MWVKGSKVKDHADTQSSCRHIEAIHAQSFRRSSRWKFGSLMICSSISDPSQLPKYRRFPREVFREADTMKARACEEQLAPSVRGTGSLQLKLASGGEEETCCPPSVFTRRSEFIICLKYVCILSLREALKVRSRTVL